MSVGKDQMVRENKLISRGYNFKMIEEQVSYVMELEVSMVWKAGKSCRRLS